MYEFLKFILGMKLYMFRRVPRSIIRSFSLYTQQWYISYRHQDRDGTGVPSRSCSQVISKPVWLIPLLCVQWKTPDDGQRNCPNHVEFHSKNKFEKLVRLVGFIIRNLTRCTVTWMSNSEMIKLWPILINHVQFCNKHWLSTLFPLLEAGIFFRRFTLMIGLYQNAAFQETTIAHLEQAYTHAHTHAYTTIYTHKHIHTHTHTYAHLHNTHTYTHIYTHAHTHTYTRTYTHLHTPTHIHILTHTYTHTYTRLHTHVHTHTHTYTHIPHNTTHTYTHTTHIHTRTHTQHIPRIH